MVDDALAKYAAKKVRERREREALRKQRIRAASKGMAFAGEAINRETRRISVSATRGSASAIRVVIVTHDRPDDLRRLLGDLRAEMTRATFTVAIYEDPSNSKGHDENLDIAHREGWEYHRAPFHVGKQRFAQWMLTICAEQLRRREELFVFLQDDVRLCSEFFSRAMAVWRSIQDSAKTTMQLMCDDVRLKSPCWTGVTPQHLRDVIQTGWVDGLFLAERAALDQLVKNPPLIDPLRWVKDPTCSSGFGEHFSRVLHRGRRRMFCVKDSLIAHVGQRSKMNRASRAEYPMISCRFVDGESVHSAFLNREPVVASMATIPSRASTLARVVDSILPQVDRLFVYLNGHSMVPPELIHPRIEVARSQDHGDRGDAGKFFWADRTQGYIFTIDDDLVYPKDYVARYIRAIEVSKRSSIIASHGRLLKFPMSSYFRDSQVFHFVAQEEKRRRVHVAGTGTTAFHSDTVKLSPRDFTTGFMADCHLAVAARKQGVPIVLVPHEAKWIAQIEVKDTLFARHVRDDGPQTVLLNSVSPWP